MRELAFTTMALLGLAVLTGFWLEAPTTRSQLLPPVDAPPPAHPADATSQASDALADDDIAYLEAASFLGSRHTGLAQHEIDRLARTIVDEARRHNLEPALVIGVIRVESAGYNFAVSHVGAFGLMQIMPPTGEELARRFGVPWHGEDTLFDPFVNVKLGTAYLRELTDRYDGNIATALAAYNWGPGNVDRRLRKGGRIPTLYPNQVFEARQATLAQSS